MLANLGVVVAIPMADSRAGTCPSVSVDESRALGENVEAPKRSSALAEINFRTTRSRSAGSRYSHGSGSRHLHYR